jgi:putative ABC transport system permease protein
MKALLLGWRGVIRPLLRNPRGTMAGILSVALGVAVFLAISIANRSAVGSFHSAFAMVAGHADLEIRGVLPDTLLPAVRKCPGIDDATPIVESVVTLPDFPGETLHLVGIDPFTAPGLLGMEALGADEGGVQLEAWLGDPNMLAVTGEFLTRHRLVPGAAVRVQGPGAPRVMTVRTGVKASVAEAASGSRVAALDISTAQEWIGTSGRLSAILIKLRTPGDRDAVAESLRRLLPADATIDPPARRSRQVDLMLSAFRLNLTALSLVSLMVGMFFVGNAAAAAVVKRRVSLGILRAVGTGRGTIMGMVLSEAGLCGLCGSLLGVLAAPVLASVLAAPVAKTVTSLYLPVDAHGGWPSPWEALAGMAAGVAASVVAAWIPARQAASVDPTRVLHPGTAPEIFPMPGVRLFLIGVGMLCVALLCSLGSLHGGPAWLGFAAAFFVLAGFSLMVPLVITASARLLGRMFRTRLRSDGALLRIALEQTLRSLHRTAPTVAALAASVAMTVGISVMIHSFRGSVVAWAGRTLTADLFIAPASNEVLGLVHTLPEGAAAWWASRPGVRAVGTFREVEARTAAGDSVTLGVVEGPARGEIDFLHGDGRAKSAALERGEGVALSESLGRRLGLAPGDAIVLASPQGPKTLRVLDLYRDYTRDRGIALIGAGFFRSSWGELGIHSLAVEFSKGVTPEEIERERAAFVKAFGGGEAFVCYSNRLLRARILEIFNQTFAVTSVLRTISILVAVGGVMLTLGILVMERVRDIGVLRSMGASFRQIAAITLAEATLIGLIASLVGLVSGSVLALVLTWVINRAFFGWSIDLAYPWWELALLPLWMIATSLVAGLVPAWQAARIEPSAALRME